MSCALLMILESLNVTGNRFITWHCGNLHEQNYNYRHCCATVNNWRAPWKNRTSRYISFFRPSLNGVLFPMFCLLVEGKC